MIKAEVIVDPNLDAMFAEAIAKARANGGAIDTLLHETAVEVGFAARHSAEFQDYKDTPRENAAKRGKRSKNAQKLRDSITVERSRFPGGGFIVAARAPHAHLVELGHLLVRKDKAGRVTVIKHVPAHPFMRRAAAEGKRSALAKLAEVNNG